MSQCFNKVRVKDKDDKEITNLFDKRRSLRPKSDSESKKELQKVEEKLADKCSKNNYLKIKEELKGMESDAGMHPGKLWKLKKKLSPQCSDPPTAMLDPNGNLVTSMAGVEKLALKHYQNILGNKVMDDDLKHVQEDKEELSALRLDLAKKNKSQDWTMDDLNKVLKFLKKNKSRDPLDFANEIFKPNVAGEDLRQPLTRGLLQ